MIKGLDRYLTKEPEDNYTPYCEEVYNNVSDEVWKVMEQNKFVDSAEENAFLNYLFDKGVEPKEAAKDITSFFKSYFFRKYPKEYYSQNISKLK